MSLFRMFLYLKSRTFFLTIFQLGTPWIFFSRQRFWERYFCSVINIQEGISISYIAYMRKKSNGWPNLWWTRPTWSSSLWTRKNYTAEQAASFWFPLVSCDKCPPKTSKWVCCSFRLRSTLLGTLKVLALEVKVGELSGSLRLYVGTTKINSRGGGYPVNQHNLLTRVAALSIRHSASVHHHIDTNNKKN